MNQKRLLIAIVALLLVPSMALASGALHNNTNGLDVDNNGLVTPRDLLLVINDLQRLSNPPTVTPLASTTQYFTDTNNSGFISPIDALLVVNHLAVPEPSSIVTAGAALAALAGFAYRRRRPRSA